MWKDTSQCKNEQSNLFYKETTSVQTRPLATLTAEIQEKNLKHLPDFLAKYERRDTNEVYIIKS